MGIEVFVLDTGWYEKTGDWQVNRTFFPDNLKAVRERLSGYGMKLGLWFSPNQAAVTSQVVRERPDCRMSIDGKLQGPFEVWETEPSYKMCLASPYWESFADELIRLYRELGVSYFKWDAVGQYGCNAPGHFHGDEEHSPRERSDRYAFEMGRYMIKIVDKLCAACPEAIVDFDITEGRRFVGLGYLAAGKYFLINNGPYFPNFGHPYDWATATTWSNVFVYPGPARARVCRGPLEFDKWLPSVLFLTHYLPDDGEESQMLNIASLILGQNGIWGDLLSVSPEGVARFGRWLDLYKQVRKAITRADPVRQGIVGGSPELHEKIDPANGHGAVAVFAEVPSTYRLVTRNRVAREYVATEGVTVRFDADGRALLELDFRKPGAKLVFFGVKEC
jgi:alpha-galactosidase